MAKRTNFPDGVEEPEGNAPQGQKRDQVAREKANWAAAIAKADLDQKAHELFAEEGGTDLNSIMGKPSESDPSQD